MKYWERKREWKNVCKQIFRYWKRESFLRSGSSFWLRKFKNLRVKRKQERERVRGRKRDRELDRERAKKNGRERNRKSERKIDREIVIYIYIYRERGRQRDRERNKDRERAEDLKNVSAIQKSLDESRITTYLTLHKN